MKSSNQSLKIKLIIWIPFLLSACFNSSQVEHCAYGTVYEQLGNKLVDTIRVNGNLVDPIDDPFEKTDFGFVKRANRIYKKSKTHRRCNQQMITVEYYQDFTDRIKLTSYEEYNDRYFTNKGTVSFWWTNSDGHLIIPINNADPKSFKPFDNICGGTDKSGIYYGCPNRGVYQLNIPVQSNFEFVAKENNYWNAPSHYLIIEDKVYDIKYELKKGYFCSLDETISKNEVLKIKK